MNPTTALTVLSDPDRDPWTAHSRGPAAVGIGAAAINDQQTSYERMENVATELSNSELMNQFIRGKAPHRQEEDTDLSPEEVIANVAKVVESLPESELEPFRDAIFAALYPEADAAGAAS